MQQAAEHIDYKPQKFFEADARYPLHQSKNYWCRVREICDQNDILLIFDEIPSAIGRTGKCFL